MSAHRDPRTLEDASVPETTRRTYQSGLRHYQRWGGVLPATIATLRQYLADHSLELAPSTLENRLAAISRFHREAGWSDPTRDPAVLRVMKGIRKEAEHAPEQAEPLLWHELQQVIRHLESQIEVYPASERAESDTLRAIRDRAVLLVGWWGALRASDIARLKGHHVTSRETGWELVLFGKGDKENKGERLPLQTGYEPSPHAALTDWTNAVTAEKGVALFRGIHPTSGRIQDQPINVKTVTRIIQKRAAEAGLTRHYSSHSLRRGWAVSWAAGMTLGEFMKRGRWKSAEVAAHYQVYSQEYFQQQGWVPQLSVRSSDPAPSLPNAPE